MSDINEDQVSGSELIHGIVKNIMNYELKSDSPTIDSVNTINNDVNNLTALNETTPLIESRKKYKDNLLNVEDSIPLTDSIDAIDAVDPINSIDSMDHIESFSGSKLLASHPTTSGDIFNTYEMDESNGKVLQSNDVQFLDKELQAVQRDLIIKSASKNVLLETPSIPNLPSFDSLTNVDLDSLNIGEEYSIQGIEKDEVAHRKTSHFENENFYTMPIEPLDNLEHELQNELNESKKRLNISGIHQDDEAKEAKDDMEYEEEKQSNFPFSEISSLKTELPSDVEPKSDYLNSDHSGLNSVEILGNSLKMEHGQILLNSSSSIEHRSLDPKANHTTSPTESSFSRSTSSSSSSSTLFPSLNSPSTRTPNNIENNGSPIQISSSSFTSGYDSSRNLSFRVLKKEKTPSILHDFENIQHADNNVEIGNNEKCNNNQPTNHSPLPTQARVQAIISDEEDISCAPDKTLESFATSIQLFSESGSVMNTNARPIQREDLPKKMKWDPIPSKPKLSRRTQSKLFHNIDPPLLPSIAAEANPLTQEYKNIFLERSFSKYLYFINKDWIIYKNYCRCILLTLVWMSYITSDIIKSITLYPQFSLALQPFDTVFFSKISIRLFCFLVLTILILTLFILDIIVQIAEKKGDNIQQEQNVSLSNKKSAQEILALKRSLSSRFPSVQDIDTLKDDQKAHLFGVTESFSRHLRIVLHILDWIFMISLAIIYICAATVSQLRMIHKEWYFRSDMFVILLATVATLKLQIRYYFLVFWVYIVTLLAIAGIYFGTGVLIYAQWIQVQYVVASVVLLLVFFIWLSLQFYTMEKIRRSRFWNRFWRREEMKLHQKEVKRANDLTMNILPKEIAMIHLKEKVPLLSLGQEKSVIISNLINFHIFSENNSNKDVFRVLSTLLNAFDSLAEEYDIKKIKTCGDEYIAVDFCSMSDEACAVNSVVFAYQMLQVVNTMNEGYEGDTLMIHVAVCSGDIAMAAIGNDLITLDVYGQPVQNAFSILKQRRKNVVQISSSIASRIHPHFYCEDLPDEDTFEQHTFKVTSPTSEGMELLQNASHIFSEIKILNDILNIRVNIFASGESLRLGSTDSLNLHTPQSLPGRKPLKSAIISKETSQSHLSSIDQMESELLEENEELQSRIRLLDELDITNRFDNEFEIRYKSKKLTPLPSNYFKYLSYVFLMFYHFKLWKQYKRDQYQDLLKIMKISYFSAFLLVAAETTVYILNFSNEVSRPSLIIQYISLALFFLGAVLSLLPKLSKNIVYGHFYCLMIILILCVKMGCLVLLPWDKLHFLAEVTAIFAIAIIYGMHYIHFYIRFIITTAVTLYLILLLAFTNRWRIDQVLNVVITYGLLTMYNYRMTREFLKLFALQHQLLQDVKQHETAFKYSKYLLYSAVPDRILKKIQEADGTVVAENIKNGSILFVEIYNLDSLYGQGQLEEVVYIVNSIFSAFDKIVNDNVCVKLKSRYFSYSAMCFSNDRHHRHTIALTKCALAMIDEARKILRRYSTNAHIKIGIETASKELGYIHGGVVGRTFTSYEVVGKVAHLAKCLAQTSLPFKLQVDQFSNQILEATFDIQIRGEVTFNGVVGTTQIDNKELQTYFVLQKQAFASLDKKNLHRELVDDYFEEGENANEIWPI